MFVLGAQANAAESNRIVTDHGTVSLVSPSETATGTAIPLGLLFRTKPGWHIYWKNPGDAGEPPTVDVTQPVAAKVGDFTWPAPQWFVVAGVGDYVETGTVLLPFTTTLHAPIDASGTTIVAAAKWLTCSETICIPERGTFAIHLRAGTPVPSSETALFTRAASDTPQPTSYRTRIAADGELIVTGSGLGPSTVASAHFFPDLAQSLVNVAPQPLSFVDGGFTLHLKTAGWKPGTQIGGVLETTDPAGTTRASTIVASPGQIVPSAPVVQTPLVLFILGAFLGGLILNLMPCVFPVLAIKAFNVANLGIADRSAARLQSLAYAAGAILAMVALGSLLLALRAGGQSFGWGFEFQSPIFITVMAWLIFAIGLNFAGLFEVTSGISNFGSGVAARGGLLGSFATGLLAVAVATPCTAPFMGAAVAAALAAPPLAALSIFAALGLGVALPFLLLGFVPGLGRLLPKPGPWMVVLRQLLAFPMFATVVWLMWVMGKEAGADGTLILASGGVLIAFALWVSRFGSFVPRALALAAIIATLSLLPRISESKTTAESSVSGAVPYSEGTLASLLAAGTPVFVDMSAAWCITCLANESVALAPASTHAAFLAHHVTLMVGDWTRRDPAITTYLQAHGRDGVPLYVYYPPHHGSPHLLPQILTPKMVTDEIGRSS